MYVCGWCGTYMYVGGGLSHTTDHVQARQKKFATRARNVAEHLTQPNSMRMVVPIRRGVCFSTFCLLEARMSTASLLSSRALLFH